MPDSRPPVPQETTSPFKRALRSGAGRIVLIYALISALWIAYSDRVLMSTVRDPEMVTKLATIKGWAFVLASALLLYVLMKLDEARLTREIKARQLADRELHEMVEQLRWLGDNLPDSYIYQVTQDGDSPPRFLYLSGGAERVHGLPVAALMQDSGLVFRQTMPEQLAAMTEAARQSRNLMADFNQHCVIVRPDGQKRWLQMRARPRKKADGAIVWDGLAVDITPLKHAEQQLVQQQALLNEMGRIAKIGGWSLDVKTGLWSWTEETARIHDLETLEPIGRERGLEFYTEASRPKIAAAVQAAIAHGISYDLELEIISAKGARKRIRTIGHPVMEGGKVVRLTGSLQDITAQHELEQKFLRAQRLEAIGTLAGGIAHDLNNILAPVLMIAGLMKERMTSPGDQKTLDLLEGSARRGAAVIRQLLTFSRGVGGEKLSVQLRHLLKELGSLMRETFPRDITLTEHFDPKLWPVHGDPTQLQQVFMNLCVNARDAMPNGGTLTISAANVELAEDAPPPHHGAQPGKYVVISVADTGEGIAPENIEKIFEPFFTTKAPGIGTGLGLSTAMAIAKGHGGFITVVSAPGQGATFKVWLPAKVLGEESMAVPSSGIGALGRGELLLVVDDEPAICSATRLLLESHNYRVLTASNGSEALMKFVEHQDEVQLVLTDLMMPVMGGTALIQSLRTIRPQLRIIAATGLEQSLPRAELERLAVNDVVAKPLLAAELLELVRRRLDEGARRA